MAGKNTIHFPADTTFKSHDTREDCILFAEFPSVEFHEGLPDISQFDGRMRVLLIIDDLMNEADQKVCDIFTKLSHHRNVSVVFVIYFTEIVSVVHPLHRFV